jgi:creatinine amidohydrolase/Fe(II)-dependent formamide hydrolase-like protein
MQFPLRHGLACFILLSAARIACAQAPDTVFLQDLTWTELRDRIHAGTSTIIIPIGGTEQSGPAVALGKHNARANALSQRIAQELGGTLVAPVVAYVPEGSYAPPTSHMRFPGTITVPDQAFEQVLESAANSFKVHGFTHIVFLGDHGGYQNDIRHVVERLNKQWAGSGARAFQPPEYYKTSSDGYAAILRQHGFRNDEIGTHAGLADTALQLAVAPQMVRQRTLRNGSKPRAADGVYGGDPRHATAQLGRLGVDAIVANTVAALRKSFAERQ